MDRGQTVLDFAVGTSVFLLAVAFTFAFVPSLLEPFSAGEGARLVVAERGAARLVETSLSAGSAPGVLSAACTADFFDGADPADAECNWDANADDLAAEIGVAGHLGVQVTVTQGGNVVDEIAGRDVTAAGGEEPPPRASVSTGSRVVTFDDDAESTYRLTVRVW